MKLRLRERKSCRWDLIALGEVMLRFDPGERRIWTARTFEVSEGGGEYNVARALKRCFGLETAIVTALVDNPVGRLVQDLIYQGGVDQSLSRWVPDDGVGRNARNGLNFTERGFGVRPPLGCSDRGHTAVSQLKPGDIDWDEIFGRQGACWFHTGGIFSALSDSTADVVLQAVQAARKHGTIVSYDLNYRDSLWKSVGGKERAREVNCRLAPYVDVLLGNEEDFSAALGIEVEGQDEHFSKVEVEAYKRVLAVAAKKYDSSVVAITLRRAITASRNDWGAVSYDDGEFFESTYRRDLEIMDRVGGGDSFASGLIYGYLAGNDSKWAVECGAAHAALAMTTPGDTSMATLSEVLRLMRGAGARIAR